MSWKSVEEPRNNGCRIGNFNGVRILGQVKDISVYIKTENCDLNFDSL
jgi:hypothetical protein